MGINELLNPSSENKDSFDSVVMSGKDKLVEEIAKVIAAEAAGEGEEGMLAVGNAIRNRSKLWKKDLMNVISAKNQFYGYTAKNKDSLYKQVKPIADKIASEIVSGTIKDNTCGATYFRQPTEKIMSWHGNETVRIGNHIFHKDKE